MVTVVVPVYNMAQYLERAVETLLKQTYKDIEIILVDDGSTDNGPELCDQLAEKYDIIRTIHKENGGLSSARNCGIENAKGEFIIFPDPDDWVSEEYIESLMTIHEKYNSQLEVSSYYIVDEEKQVDNPICKEITCMTEYEAMKAMLIGGGMNGFAWNKMYHMDIINEYNMRFDEELGMAQDLHFAIRYALHCKCVALTPKMTYFYFQHIGGVTNPKAKLTPRKKSGLKTYEKLIEFLKDDYPEAEALAHCTLANMSLQFIYIYYNSGMDDKEFLDLLKVKIRENKSYFFANANYSTVHKMISRFAYVSPKLYFYIRKILRG